MSGIAVNRSKSSAIIVLGLMLVVVSCGGCGDDPVEPTQPPRITAFTAAPTDILPGDSSLLSFTVEGASELILQPGNPNLADSVSGFVSSIFVFPLVPTTYTLIATNSSGTDSSNLTITMSAAVPSIGTLALSADTLLIGESTTLSWQAARADSIVIDNGIGKLSSPVSGQQLLSPFATTVYTAIAFNDIGRDTLAVTVIVQDPQNIVAVGGLYYTGLMGQSTQTPNMTFRVVDKVGLNISRLWIHFPLLQGDGIFSADSLLPVNSGVADLSYAFSGALGHAVIRAVVPGVDSVDLIVRANTLIPGIGGQGQFALFGEEWGMVKNFNGTPAADESDPTLYIQYQDYEAQLGVVVMVRDLNQNEIAEDTEPVMGIIVNTIYQHKTADSIGIGSHLNDVLALYSTPDNIRVDTTDLPPGEPPGIAYDYLAEGLTFWTSPTDSSIFEIHIVDTSIAPVSGILTDWASIKIGTELSSAVRHFHYRRWLGVHRPKLTP